MKHYTVTFYSHYDALNLGRNLKGRKVESSLMPVPRKLSSSCGTCLTFTAEDEFVFDEELFGRENIECVYETSGSSYELILDYR